MGHAWGFCCPGGRGIGRLGIRPHGDGEVIGDQTHLFAARAEAQTRNVQATCVLDDG